MIRVERRERVLEITMDRAPANQIDQQACRDLDAAFDLLRDDDQLLVGIVTGAGDRFFTAGWDLKAVARGEEEAESFGEHGFMGIAERYDLNKPLIAAINGMAAGGGFEMALACDMVVAAEHAQLTLPEVLSGFIAEAGGTLRLPRRIPYAIAIELLLTGRRMGAEEAQRWGLVNRIVPRGQALEAARALADQLLAAAPLAVQAVKELIRETDGLNVPDAYRRMRSGLPAFTRMRASEDRREGPRAFAEKRKPTWQGR